MTTDTPMVVDQLNLFIRQAISSWESQNKRINSLLETLTETEWHGATAPGRNSGKYLLGHLIAVNDGMLTLLGVGDRMFAELDEPYVKKAEDAAALNSSIEELKSYWQRLNTELSRHFNAMTADDWFTGHTAVSPEDFAKEPHRNKMNILLSRTIHQGYHLGQLVYLLKKK
ncbi:MAG: DinB family protein [Chitinophagaceae bacterium]|nr:DinB family protein [Chitinophagaceae bacterium]